VPAALCVLPAAPDVPLDVVPDVPPLPAADAVRTLIVEAVLGGSVLFAFPAGGAAAAVVLLLLAAGACVDVGALAF
jgi:hypothetical protein